MKSRGFYLHLNSTRLIFASVLGICGIVLLFMFRVEAADGAENGLLLCGRVIIPALFPFTALAMFISRSGAASLIGKLFSPLFRLLFGAENEAATAVLLSFVSGYPVGARLLCGLYENSLITAGAARRLMLFCVNPGPAFVITAVGGIMLGSVKAGAVMFTAVCLSSVTVGVLSRPVISLVPERETPPSRKLSAESRPIRYDGGLAAAFADACADAAGSIIEICAFTVFFSVAAAVLRSFAVAASITPVVLPAIEITSGISLASTLPLPLIAAYISFGGLSVHFQILRSSGRFFFTSGELFCSRAASAVLAALFTALLLKFFPAEVDRSAAVIKTMVESGRGSIASSVTLILALAVFLGAARQQVSRRA